VGANCARCGACCEEIYIPTDAVTLMADTFPEPASDAGPPDPSREVARKVWAEIRAGEARDHQFFRAHWHPVMDGTAQRSREVQGRRRFAYTCDAFDPARRLCTAHDDRPLTCRRYPWYGEPPVVTAIRFAQCSYWHDIPPEQWPTWVDPLPSREDQPVDSD
jgi:Fe-S-cluster containining protein